MADDKMLERARAIYDSTNHDTATMHERIIKLFADFGRAIRREALLAAAAASCPYCRRVETYGYPHVDLEGLGVPCFAPGVRALIEREEE